MTRVVVLDSGLANVASVRSAFRALGAVPTVTRDPAVAESATHLVLPGVGAFGPGMASLRAARLDRTVRAAVDRGVPLLAICLGLQLLTDGSDEAPGVPGLGLIPGRCVRLPAAQRLPQLGWNGVTPGSPDGLVRTGIAAYANSYALGQAPPDWSAAWTSYGRPFVAALERGRVLACQFHPELSGQWGMRLLARWLGGGRPAESPISGQRTGLCRRVIACLDVADGRVVKGIRFQSLRDAGDPAQRAACYEAQGADEIVLLDVAAAPQGREPQAETVRRVRDAIHIPLTVGGGVRAVEDAARLLAAGADKVSVNTAAVGDPDLIARLAGAFGRQCVVLAIDARSRAGGWEVLVLGGRQPAGLDALAWARRAEGFGAGEVLLTSWDRDGTRAGFDLDLLRAMRAAVRLPVIASGGVGRREDFGAAFEAGADAALAASLFHDGDDTIGGVKQWLLARGHEVRP